MFYPEKLTLARKRRGLTKAKLAELSGLSVRTITSYETPSIIDTTSNETVERLAEVLRFPVEFFSGELPTTIDSNAVSFRAVTKLSAKLRDASLAAGDLALMLNNWMHKEFELPPTNLPDYSRDTKMTPEAAAIALRQEFGIGELSIKNIVHLIESRGVRVFSLAEDCSEVDAFSFWQDGEAFMLLNTQKTYERSRFDAAHELAHLVLHKQLPENRREAELEADQFASAFLMPRSSFLAKIPLSPSFYQLDGYKKHWKVSLAAMVKRSHDLKLTTEWQNRALNIELGKRGYRKSEPNPSCSERETSLLLRMALDYAQEQGRRGIDISEEIMIPVEELRNLTFDHPIFNLEVIKGKGSPSRFKVHKAPDLKVI